MWGCKQQISVIIEKALVQYFGLIWWGLAYADEVFKIPVVDCFVLASESDRQGRWVITQTIDRAYSCLRCDFFHKFACVQLPDLNNAFRTSRCHPPSVRRNCCILHLLLMLVKRQNRGSVWESQVPNLHSLVVACRDKERRLRLVCNRINSCFMSIQYLVGCMHGVPHVQQTRLCSGKELLILTWIIRDATHIWNVAWECLMRKWLKTRIYLQVWVSSSLSSTI